MFLNVISLFVGFLCLLTGGFMIFNKIQNHKTNIYFIIILFVVGIQRFTYAIEFLGIVKNSYSPLKIKLSLGLFLVPVYYLFFRRLIHGFDQLKKELLHFIPPILLIIIKVLFVGYQINVYYFVFYSTFYFVLIVVLYYNFINRKNTSMLQKLSYQQIKNWLLFMGSLTLLLFAFSNYFVFYPSIGLGTFYKYSSLLWLLVLVYMFKNPVVVFGEQYFLKNMQTEGTSAFLIWSKKRLLPLEEKDKIVFNTIAKRIDLIISEIKVLEHSAQFLSQITFTADALSKQLKIPRRHLEFVFKYYCTYSVSDYSNLVKIKYAVTLINSGFLEDYTIESLGEKCLFKSRFTFSKNFKKFVGVSVSDYIISDVESQMKFF